MFDALRRVRGGRAAAGEEAAGVRGEAGAGIGEVYAALDAVLKGWADKSAARYKPAADPFSFDLQPRADLTAFYVEPAQTRPAVGYLGSAGLDVATVTIWASREARDDAGAAGLDARERPTIPLGACSTSRRPGTASVGWPGSTRGLSSERPCTATSRTTPRPASGSTGYARTRRHPGGVE